MFDIELVVKIVAVVVAVGLLLSSVDFSYLLAKLSVKNGVVVKVDDNQFLKTLELWYLLKKQCNESKLTAASEKMDEVFPLLNDNVQGV